MTNKYYSRSHTRKIPRNSPPPQKDHVTERTQIIIWSLMRIRVWNSLTPLLPSPQHKLWSTYQSKAEVPWRLQILNFQSNPPWARERIRTFSRKPRNVLWNWYATIPTHSSKLCQHKAYIVQKVWIFKSNVNKKNQYSWEKSKFMLSFLR